MQNSDKGAGENNRTSVNPPRGSVYLSTATNMKYDRDEGESEEWRESMSSEGSRSEVVCVTGGSGFIGSWVVCLLLRRGYIVHATVQDISLSNASSPFMVFIYLFTSLIFIHFCFRCSHCCCRGWKRNEASRSPRRGRLPSSSLPDRSPRLRLHRHCCNWRRRRISHRLPLHHRSGPRSRGPFFNSALTVYNNKTRILILRTPL